MKSIQWIHYVIFFSIICIVYLLGEKSIKNIGFEQNSPKTESHGHALDAPDQYAKFHQLIRASGNDTIASYPPNYLFDEFAKAKKRLSSLNIQVRDDFNWESRGPGNVGGRTRGLVLDVRDPSLKTWYLGAVAGGIWRTKDAGETWENLSNDLPNLAISWMAQSANNPNVFYASTGNAFVSRGTNGGGLLKSIDGGDTWNILPGTLNGDFTNIYRITINPGNGNEIIVCTVGRREFGFSDNRSRILKSTDGGLNWQLKYSKTGGHIQQVIHASPDTLFASINGEGLIRSTNAGDDWIEIWSPPSDDFGRMELAAMEQYVYVTVDEGDGVDKIYKSFDHGESWFELKRMNGSDISGWLGGQGWFDNTIAIYPEDPNIIFAAGQSAIIRLTSTNNPIGNELLSSFEVITDGYRDYGSSVRSKGVHVDHHNLILSINTTSDDIFILNANDGGVSFSTDGGETFKQTGDAFKFRDGQEFQTLGGYITSQFYGVDKMNGADRYVGGTQDNGSWVSMTDPGESSVWRSAPSGDGFEAAWNYGDVNEILESSQFNNIYKSRDGGNSWLNVNLPESNGPFITRIASSKLQPDLVFLASSIGLLRSNDFGDSWDVIEMPEDWQYNSTLGPPIEISLASPRVVWSGARMREGNNVCLSTNGGVNFTPVNRFDSESLGRITGIASHPTNEKTAFLLFSVPDAPKVLRTQDYGETWKDLSAFNEDTGFHDNGYPDVATYSLLVMPFDTNMIWAGTDIGIFESVDNGATWNYSNNGFPATPVWEMVVVNDEIIVATHGRGVWTTSVLELEGYEPIATVGLPSLETDENFGSIVSGLIELADPYDSSHFQIILPTTQEVIFESKIESNDEAFSESFNIDLSNHIPIDTILDIELKLIAFDGTQSFVEKDKVEVFIPIDTPILDYQNDFETEEAALAFARKGFFVGSPETDLSNGLNTPHFHGPNLFLKSILRHPILVQESSILTFDEIVLVEPGDSFDPDNSSFWDYVQVEGTADKGKSWTRLSRYDSNEDNDWMDAYDDNGSGDASLVRTKIFDLSTYFEPGREVFLRFSFFSDAFVNGWGWWIDQIDITSGAVPVQDVTKLDHEFQMEIFPNPAIEKSNLKILLSKGNKMKINIISSDGKLMQNIYSGHLEPGSHLFPMNISGYAKGLYFVQFQVGDFVHTQKLIVE
jgi:photosystem II stability/assembly factor-like uncharacterized protein